MSVLPDVLKHVFRMLAAVALITVVGQAHAQRAPVQIGGPNGIIMGGGMGFKVGGKNGVHFGGGQGAKFGPTEFGMHFGNGQGARFGGRNVGMQFGGGQGARFGSPEFGMQFGHGEGARFGSKDNPLMQFGGGKGVVVGGQPLQPQPEATVQQPQSSGPPALEGPANEPTPKSNSVPAEPTPAVPDSRGAFSVWEK